MKQLQVRIPDFFSGRKVLVTGFSGFMGKALVEKLVYSCPNISTIYVTMRPKKGKCVEERLKEIFESLCFERLRTERPGVSETKIVPLVGDICQPDIGLSEQDLNTVINNVSIIYHSAADVKFTEPLSQAIYHNTKSTFYMIELAKKINNLECFLYVSTAYSNCNYFNIKEEIYPALADWKKTFEICEKVDSTILQVLTQKYTKGMPNTYVYSKQLCEALIHSYREIIPVAIIRPSVVMGAVKDPFPGWYDSLFGPGLLYMGIASGVMKNVLMGVEVLVNSFPVDYITSGTIIASVQKIVYKERETVPVYNCCASEDMQATNLAYVEYLSQPAIIQDLRREKFSTLSLRNLTSSKFWFTVQFIYNIMFTAYLVDGFLKLIGQEPMLVKIRRKGYRFSQYVSYFTLHTYKFATENFNNLPKILMEEDHEHFYYDLHDTDIDQGFLEGYYYTKRTYFKDTLVKSDIRKYIKIINYLDLFFCCATYYVAGFSLYWCLKSFYFYFQSNFSLF